MPSLCSSGVADKIFYARNRLCTANFNTAPHRHRKPAALVRTAPHRNKINQTIHIRLAYTTTKYFIKLTLLLKSISKSNLRCISKWRITIYVQCRLFPVHMSKLEFCHHLNQNNSYIQTFDLRRYYLHENIKHYKIQFHQNHSGS